jgi:tetratricopeptide (TPR) repeat protein
MTTDEQQSIEQRGLSPALAVFGLALAVRAIFLLQSLGAPYFGAPFLDEQFYYEWAVRISHGQLVSPHAFFRAPLYAYLLGGLFALIGPNFFLPKLLQHLLGSVAAVLVFKVAEKCVDRRTAWVAGLLAAFYPPLIFFEGEMLDISLQCFFYPALILVGVISLRDPRWRWTILLGMVAGAAIIARPNALLLVGCWLALQVILAPRWGGLGAALERAGAIGLLVVLWMAPTLIHNIRADGSWAPISTYAGINFYIGNRPAADGYTASTPQRYESYGEYEDSVDLFARRKAEEVEKHPLNGAAVQRYWLKEAWKEIAAAPERTALLLLKKIVLFWNGYEIRNNKDIYFALQFTPALDWLHRVWSFRVLSPLALLGIVLVALKGRSVEDLWLFLGVAAHVASVVLFFVCDRYRLPVTPLLIVFAAGALTTLWQWARERRFQPMACAMFGLVPLAVLANVRWYDMSPVVPHKDVWNVANCYKAKGQLDEALRWYERFIQLNPKFAEGWNNLGEAHVRLALKGGQMDEARMKMALDCFKRAAYLDDRLSIARSNLGFCHLKMGNAKEALAAYDSAVAAAAPNDSPLAHSGRAEALAALGRDDEALDELDRLLHVHPNFVPALWTKAAILARRGETTEARNLALRAIELAPPATAAEIRADPLLKDLLSPKSQQKQP